jgi:hypothetical protein
MIEGASPSGAIGAGFAVVRRVRVAGFLAAAAPEAGVAAAVAAPCLLARDVVPGAFAGAFVARAVFDAATGFAGSDSAAGFAASASDAAPVARAALGAEAGFAGSDSGAAPALFDVFAPAARDERAAPVPPDARDAERAAVGAAGVASAESPSVGRSPSDGGCAVLIRLLPKG